MQKSRPLIFSLFLAFTVTACAGEMQNGGPETSQEELTSILDATWDALGEQDLELFQEFVLRDWRLYTARGNKFDAETLVGTHQQNLTNFNIEMQNLEIDIHGSMAWATYDAQMSALAGGDDWGGEFIMTTVFVRENGAWKIAHMHESIVQ